jgi:hypothetical protein
MIRYPDGSEARAGDLVLLDRGERTGRVSTVIDSAPEMRAWGLDEPGLMIESEFYGLLFLPQSAFDHDEIKLISQPTA